MKEPILAEKEYIENDTNYRLKVKGGLHYLRGNSTPHFSITAEQYRKEPGRKWDEDGFDCCHEYIEEKFPGMFTDLIALHLSEMDGGPMHAEGNAFYYAGGCGDTKPTEAGIIRHSIERTLALYDCQNIPAAVNAAMLEIGRDKETTEIWERYENTGKPETLAEHLRIPLSIAAKICGEVMAGSFTKEDMRDFVKLQRKRWKSEAEAAIKKHGLVIYGDEWQAA